jgi:hypothetical protein
MDKRGFMLTYVEFKGYCDILQIYNMDHLIMFVRALLLWARLTLEVFISHDVT